VQGKKLPESAQRPDASGGQVQPGAAKIRRYQKDIGLLEKSPTPEILVR